MTYCRNLWLFMVAGMQILRGPMGISAAENPCSDIFQYKGDPGNAYGIITVPNPYPDFAIEITVEMYITAPVPRDSPTNVEPVDRDIWRKLYAGSGDPVLYRLDFPVSSPLPTIKSITVNQNVICRGTRPPNTGYLTTVTVQHTVFNDRCNSASLECPYNIRQSQGTRPQTSPHLPPKQYIEDSSSPTSPCPDIFRYEPDGSGNWHGIVSVPNPYPVVAIDISVQLYAAALTSSGNGRFELINDLNKEWDRMQSDEQFNIQYRLDFPMQSPLPAVKSITVNNQQICQGSKPNSPALTTLSYQHSLFTTRNWIRQTPSTTSPQSSQEPTKPKPSPPSPSIPTPSKPGMNPTCGLPVVRTIKLIVNGTNPTPGQWPWHVALYVHKGNGTVYQCGGSFVGTRTIITAAHCVTNNTGEIMPARDFTVYLGRYDLRNHKEQNTQQINVRNIYVHEEYNATYIENDIAMLLLNSSVQITAEVRPVCLWKQGDTSLQSIIEKDGVVVGWGRDEFGKTEDKLKMVKMPVVSQKTCIESNIQFYSVYTHKTTFCAGFRNGSSVCDGDSGGGMVFPETQSNGNLTWNLRGIVSTSMADDYTGQGCNVKNYIIFTDIAPYLDWIDLYII